MGSGEQQAEVRDIRNPPFYWVESVLLERYGRELGPYGLAVYDGLAYFANQKTNQCWPSFQTIAHLVGCSRRQVIRKLQQLEKLGLISVERRGKTSSVYTLLSVVTDSHHQRPGSDRESPSSDRESPSSDRESPEQESLTRRKNNGLVDVQEQEGIVTLLRDFRVSEGMARKLAETTTSEVVEAWISYAQKATSLNDPVAFVVSKVRAGEIPPKKRGKAERNRHRYIEGKYADIIQH